MFSIYLKDTSYILAQELWSLHSYMLEKLSARSNQITFFVLKTAPSEQLLSCRENIA